VENEVLMALIIIGALVIVVLIFGSAYWFANRVKEGNVRFAWLQKRERRERAQQKRNAISDGRR